MSQVGHTGDTLPQRLSASDNFVVLMCVVPPAMIGSTMLPVLQKMQEALATSPTDSMLIRVALAVSGFGMLVGSPLAGWVIDRIGVRLLEICSIALWIVLGCVNYAVSDLHVLIAIRFVQGMAAGTVMIGGTIIASKISNEVERGRLMGIAVMIGSISGLIAMVLAGIIGDINWRYTFFLHLIYLPALVGAVMLSKDKIPQHIATAAAAAVGFWKSFPYGLAFISFMAGLVMFCDTAYVPFRFRAVGVESSKLIAFAMISMAIMVATFSALYGFSRRWLTAEGSFKVSFAIAALGALITALAPNYWGIVIGQFFYGIGVGPLVPNILALASAWPSHIRGRVTGLVKGLNYGSYLVGAIILEPVMRLGGPSTVMITVAIMALAVAAGVMVAGSRSDGTSRLRPLGQSISAPATES